MSLFCVSLSVSEQDWEAGRVEHQLWLLMRKYKFVLIICSSLYSYKLCVTRKNTHILKKEVCFSKVLTLPCAYAAAMFTDPGLETSASFNYTGRSQGHLSLYITLVDVQVMRLIL